MTRLLVEADEHTPLLQDGLIDPAPEAPIQSVLKDVDKHSVSRLRGTLIACSLFFLIFFQAANMSGLTTTQSQIAEDLNAFGSVSWFASTYLIASASLAPVAGRLSQVFSPRACVASASVIFGIGTLVSSQATTLSTFLVGRAVTGIGAAGLLPLSIILVLELTTSKSRGLFVGMLNTNWTIGVALGAVIAGSLVTVTGWRALFWVQTPITTIAGAGLYFAAPKSLDAVASGAKLKHKLLGIDYLGAVTLTSTVSMFLLGLSSTKIVWQYLAISAGLLIIFLLNEFLLARDPIIPTKILRSRPTFFACISQLGIMLARWTVLFYSPTYAIASLGWSAGKAGTLLVATNAGFASGGLIAGHFHIRRSGSFWLSCIVAFICFTVSLFSLALVTRIDVSPALFIIITFINGFSTGAALNYTLAHALHLTPPKTHVIVTSLMATFRNLAGSFGSAIGGGIFVRHLRSALETGFADKGIYGQDALIRKLLGSPAMVQSLHGDIKQVAVVSYASSLQQLFFAATALASVVIILQASTGWKGADPEKQTDDEVEEQV